MKAADIRKSFLDFFHANAHMVVPSASLIPPNDPTLFFTNAGMVQFKDVFTGLDQRPYSRATSVQKCLRVSGKHNDLENVGRTPRHHTFFEMLGNFSFGDYFKVEAIGWSWEWLTRHMGIPADRLWVTVHHTDDEAFEIWRREIGVPAGRIQRLGDKDNFWSMGETGPCGPCSEVHYDHGPGISDDTRGPAGEGARYVEIWNLVFMQYDRDAAGQLHPLPRPSIDTGAGLERIAAVTQGVYSNYDTDCFTPIIARAAELAGVAIGQSQESDVAMRVIADHARAGAFLVADGVMPGNEGRSYVLRRLLRRAVRYGVKIGIRGPFLWQAADTVIDQMHLAYPELAARRAFIREVIRLEEERFADTLEKGLVLLNDSVATLPADQPILDGDLVFRLYDTYGFPPDLTRLIAGEQGVDIDEPGYEAAMERQRSQGRAAWKGSGEQSSEALFHAIAAECSTSFTGYESTVGSGRVSALIKEGRRVEHLSQGDTGYLVSDSSPLYAEAGGQTGDTGTIRTTAGTLLRVLDTRRPVAALHVHSVEVLQGTIQEGESIQLLVDDPRRRAIRANHTATHLLHAALKEVLGSHVAQKGSLVTPERLRFDFSHHKPMSAEECRQVEDLVYSLILKNQPVETRVMALEEARAAGAQALFGEKYTDHVRVVGVDSFSLELCGGLHVERTGDIGMFCILGESGIAAGIRRIEAVTGTEALAWTRDHARQLQTASDLLKTQPSQLVEQLERLLADRRRLEKDLDAVRRETARAASQDLLLQAVELGDLKVLAAELNGDLATLREEAERIRDRLGHRSVVLLASRGEGTVQMVATASPAIAGKLVHAGDLIRDVAKLVGGGGGGRPDMAQAGGKNPNQLPAALASVVGLVERMVERAGAR